MTRATELDLEGLYGEAVTQYDAALRDFDTVVAQGTSHPCVTGLTSLVTPQSHGAFLRHVVHRIKLGCGADAGSRFG